MLEMMLSIASAANSSAFVPVGVIRVERMPPEAMRFDTVCADPALNVYLTRDRFQMVDVDAKTYAAKMVEFEPCRNRPNKDLISEAVSVHIVPADPAVPITCTASRTRPKPAWAESRTVVGDRAILVDLAPESTLSRRAWIVGASVPLHSLVVHRAPPARYNTTFASRDKTGRLWSHREFTPRGVIGPGVCASRPFSILPQMGQEVQL